MLIENTAIDMRFLNKNFKELDSFYNKQKLFSLYTYYFYNLKLRLTLLVNLKNNFKSSI
jgi:hypothetical protein